MIESFREWWIVETRDSLESGFYQVTSNFNTWREANYFANKCLRAARHRHARIVRVEQRRDEPRKPEPIE